MGTKCLLSGIFCHMLHFFSAQTYSGKYVCSVKSKDERRHIKIGLGPIFMSAELTDIYPNIEASQQAHDVKITSY